MKGMESWFLEASPGEKTPVGRFSMHLYFLPAHGKSEILRICYKNKIKVLISVKNMLYLTYIKITRCT